MFEREDRRLRREVVDLEAAVAKPLDGIGHGLVVEIVLVRIAARRRPGLDARAAPGAVDEADGDAQFPEEGFAEEEGDGALGRNGLGRGGDPVGVDARLPPTQAVIWAQFVVDFCGDYAG